MNRYIAAGVKTDCRILLEKFTATKSVRFDEFVKIWQEMKFACIYCGRESFAELYEFTEEALHIAKEFFFSPNPLQTRLCGLYLLYGLYYMQPTVEDGEYLVKIRLSLKEWEDSCNLMNVVQEEQHYDALYIFNKLLAESAFHFCAMPREYGLEKGIRKHLERGDNTAEDAPHGTSELLLLDETGLLNSLDVISKKYYNFKCTLNTDGRQTTPHELLNYASPSIADDLRKIMAPLTPGTHIHDQNVNELPTSIGAHRRMLKDMACYGAGPSKST